MDDVFTAPDGHQHYWDMRCTPIGPEVCLQETVHGADEHLAGYHFCHEKVGGGPRCVGGVNVDTDIPERKAFWTQTGSLTGGDLTLTPSILCTNDQYHGFVQQGKWVPA